ncbi:SPFH domain-containing protein [Ferrovibrio sp.]|uniref:SPFH domain-containing protein n=1 Tax=Ferrovibrio sp. TaxID=1917215 RepID=UPI001B79F92E|nr:SPFH domain-containing protein [Ferrovibrio sp.]MBP7062847.1 SPFH/Band 7/PHB domain protein [Ferrovibrio sp.]
MEISAGLIVAIILLALVAVTVFAGVKTVPQGQQWTVERLGKYIRTLTPGLSIIIPYIDRIGRKLSLMETVLDIPSQEVITRDNATVTADGVVFFQVLDPVKAAYEVQDLLFALSSLAMTNVRSVIGAMDLDEVLSQRDQINRRLLSVVDQATLAWGIKATRIELRNIQPPQNLLDSMAKQMTAEREKRAEILTAEGAKQASILRAEGAKQAAVLEAEGRMEAAKRDAEARERLAEAEAKATQMVSQAIADGNVAAMNYFVAQKYVEAFSKFAESPNQKLVFMPMEATGLLSSLGGIGELAKQAFGSEAAAKPVPRPWGGGSTP